MQCTITCLHIFQSIVFLNTFKYLCLSPLVDQWKISNFCSVVFVYGHSCLEFSVHNLQITFHEFLYLFGFVFTSLAGNDTLWWKEQLLKSGSDGEWRHDMAVLWIPQSATHWRWVGAELGEWRHHRGTHWLDTCTTTISSRGQQH